MHVLEVVITIHKRVRCALRVHRADTKQEHHVMAVVVLIHKSVRHAPVVDWANTKKG